MDEPLPRSFIKNLHAQLGQEAHTLLEVLETVPPVSIRWNRHKVSNFNNRSLQRVAWCEEGAYLEERPNFALDPWWHAGAYYVQEASSMMLSLLQEFLRTEKNENLTILDLCAAPGGKSTLLANQLKSGDLLISNEIHPKRFQILKENVIKWGNHRVWLTNEDPKTFNNIPNFFDTILVDAPCSGEGMFRKDPIARKEWSPGNIMHCSSRQKRILADVLPALKPGGTLIYCTCTFNHAENIDNVVWLKNEFNLISQTIPEVEKWPVCKITKEDCTGYQCFPHLIKGEGFFFAVLQKINNGNSFAKNKRFKKHSSQYQVFKDFPVQDWLADTEDWQIFAKGDDCHFLSSDLVDQFQVLQHTISSFYQPWKIGKIKGQHLVPAHSLAMSHNQSDALDYQPLDHEIALDFLRKMSIPISQKGWIIPTYKNVSLGWLKGLGNRSNNYYPKAWRLRS